MLLDLTKLQNRKENELIFNEVISLDEELYKETDIRSLSPLDVSINIHRVTDSDYSMDLNIKGTMILPCSVTLKDVNYPFEVKTELKVSNNDENDEEYVKIMQNNIDIIPIIWQNIILEVPLKVISPDVKAENLQGDGWKFITEEKVEEKDIDPRLEKLKEFLNE